jgi:hypothetical protein
VVDAVSRESLQLLMEVLMFGTQLQAPERQFDRRGMVA